MFMHICLHLDDVIIRGIFVYIWMTSSSGNRTIEPMSWHKVFLDSRLQSLEGLMDFLAFLFQK